MGLATFGSMTHTNDAPLPDAPDILKPVGHTVITFTSAQDMEDAAAALIGQGFDNAALTRVPPIEMVSRLDAGIANAGVLAPFGYELAIAKAHRMQALDGAHFLLVYGPDQAHVDRITVVAKGFDALSAQHYGTFLIQELTGLALGDAPVK